MRGIVSYGAYLPHRRLDRAEIAPVAGTGGGKGTRTVASFDEDTTTMGVEAARLALRAALAAPDTALVVSADIRTGLPGSADEANGGDAGAALLIGDGDAVAECIGAAA